MSEPLTGRTLHSRFVCQCGCGRHVNWNKTKGRWNSYLKGHSAWKRRKEIEANPKLSFGGYPKIHDPEHHRAHKKDGYVYVFIIVAEAKLGRPIAKNEFVHHLDGNPKNFHHENLDIRPKGYNLYRKPGDGKGGLWRQLTVAQIREIIQVIVEPDPLRNRRFTVNPRSNSGLARQYAVDSSTIRFIRARKLPEWVMEQLTDRASAVPDPELPADDPDI